MQPPDFIQAMALPLTSRETPTESTSQASVSADVMWGQHHLPHTPVVRIHGPGKDEPRVGAAGTRESEPHCRAASRLGPQPSPRWNGQASAPSSPALDPAGQVDTVPGTRGTGSCGRSSGTGRQDKAWALGARWAVPSPGGPHLGPRGPLSQAGCKEGKPARERLSAENWPLVPGPAGGHDHGRFLSHGLQGGTGGGGC